MGDLVRLEVDGAVGIMRLDRPPVNAIDLQLATELGEAIREGDHREDVGALVLWGGPKVFAVGADIRAMAEWGPQEVRPSVDALGAAADLLEEIDTPSVAAINGFALGGGMELALGADLRYVAEDARLGQPEIRIGVIPGAGGTQRLVRMLGTARATELVLTGRQLEAAEAVALGLAVEAVPAGQVLDRAVAVARDLAAGPRRAIAAAKASLRGAVESPGSTGIARERELFLALFGTPDQREGMRAFLEKRAPRFGQD